MKGKRKTISVEDWKCHRRTAFVTLSKQGREGRPKLECRAGRAGKEASSGEVSEQSVVSSTVGRGTKQVPPPFVADQSTSLAWTHFCRSPSPSSLPELETGRWSRRAFARGSPWSPASRPLRRRRRHRLRRERRWRQRRRRRRPRRCRPSRRPRCPRRPRHCRPPRRRSSHLRPCRAP